MDSFVFVVDVTTSTEGTVSGYGLLTSDPTLERRVWTTVTADTQPTSVGLTLRDETNDTIQLSGNVYGSVVGGTWVYATSGMSGSFRMAAEENVDLLGQRQPGKEPVVFASLFE